MEGSIDSKPRVCFQFEVEKVVGISNDGRYQVQWAPAWVSKFHLVGCEHLIREFLQQQYEEVKPEAEGRPEESEVPSSSNSIVDNVEDFCEEACNIEVKDEPEDQYLTEGIETRGGYFHRYEATSGKLDAQTSSQPPTSEMEVGLDTFTTVEHSSISDSSDSTDAKTTLTVNNESSVTTDENTQTFINSHSCQTQSYASISNKQLPHGNRPLVETRYECPQCTTTFRYKGDLSRHIRNHNGERRFSCDQCGYSSSRKYNLKLHMRVHTGEKPYECDLCGKTFARSDSLRDHKRQQHCDEYLTTDVRLSHCSF